MIEFVEEVGLTEHEVLEQALLPATVDPTVESLIANLDRGRAALQAATDDYQRLDLRDSARKAQVAAEILNRKDIAVQYSLLIADAERAIAVANPSTGRGGDHTSEQRPPAGIAIPNATLGRIRQAGSLPDDEYEKLKQEAVQRQEPLTQKAVIDAAKTLKREQQLVVNAAERQRLREDPLPLPTERYRTIVIDPPWPIDMVRLEGGNRPQSLKYPTMSLEEIEDIDIDSMLEDDAHVFLWTINRFLPDAFVIMANWGIKYRFCMVWHKDGGMKPVHYPQMNAEFVLVGVKGSPRFMDEDQFWAVFSAPRSGHSVKPEEFYQLLERIAPGPRLDMFARGEHTGFVPWGNEAEDSDVSEA